MGPRDIDIRAIAVDPDRRRVYAGTTYGLLVLRMPIAELNLRHPLPLGAATLKLSGTVSGAGRGLAGGKLHILVNGKEAGSCETDSQGSFDCAIPYAIKGKDVEVTIYYLSGCYTPSPASWLFHLVNATVDFKEPSRVRAEVEGLGWYRHGDTARLSVPPVLPRDIFTVYVFEGWKRNGVLVSASAEYSFAVTEAVELVAAYGMRLACDTCSVVYIGRMRLSMECETGMRYRGWQSAHFSSGNRSCSHPRFTSEKWEESQQA